MRLANLDPVPMRIAVPFVSKDPVRTPFRRNSGPFFLPMFAGCDVMEYSEQRHLFHDFAVDAVDPMVSVLITFRGAARLSLPQAEQSLVPGSVLILSQPSPARIMLTRTGCPWGFVYLNFRDPWPRECLLWFQQRVGQLSSRLDLGQAAGRRFVAESSRLAGDLRTASRGEELVWSARCYEWFLSMVRVLGVEADAGTGGKAGAEPVQKDWKTLAGSCRTIKEFARQMHYSPSYLSRKLKATWHRPAGEALREARLDQARQVLISTDLSVGEIAGRCGYTSASSFIRAFRLHYGITPAKARRGN